MTRFSTPTRLALALAIDAVPIGEPVEELKRRDLDDIARAGLRGHSASAQADPVGRFMPGQHAADAGDPAVWAADLGEPFQRKGGPCTVSQQLNRDSAERCLGREVAGKLR
jgi:hypothetical protein